MPGRIATDSRQCFWNFVASESYISLTSRQETNVQS